MLININEIDKKEFNVSERFLDGVGTVFLITPSHAKHKWDDKELHLRSLLCSEDGRIISGSVKKFFNYGEVPEHDQWVQEAIIAGRSWFTEKLDGSLIIRAVLTKENGEKIVHFRTRGSHQLADDFKQPVMDLVGNKYPLLLDPNVLGIAGTSQLFEFTSPDNKIILDYSKPELTLLATMRWNDEGIEVAAWKERKLQKAARILGVPYTKFHQLPNSLEEVVQEIRGWKGSEGIVVRCEIPGKDQPHFVKIKASEYIRIHSLKYHLTQEKVVMFCYIKGIKTLEALQNEMYSLGVDWEAISFIQPYFEEYLQKSERIKLEVLQLIQSINQQGILKLATRKDVALALKDLTQNSPGLFSIGIQYVFGEQSSVENGTDALILDVSVKRLENYKAEAQEFANSISKNINEEEIPDVND